MSRISTARYLLREIEHAKRRTQEVAVEGTDRVHVEHIYPQTPSGERWDHHSTMINRLGNLTLLGKRLNTAAKNADFPTKKVDAYTDSDILMTKELLDLNAWNEAAVNDRQSELSQWIFDIWKFPDEEPPLAPNGTETSPAEIDAGQDTPEQLPEVPSG